MRVFWLIINKVTGEVWSGFPTEDLADEVICSVGKDPYFFAKYDKIKVIEIDP